MKVRKAVFPAAGMGTRFLPATKAMPKEMLAIVDKPAIQYVVEEAVASGVELMILVTGRGKRAIEDHFDRALELELFLESKGKYEEVETVRGISELVRFAYTRQKEALGLGHAILQARDLVNDEPFAVLLGDDLIDSDVPGLAQLLRVREERGGSVIAVQRVPRSRTSAYGIVDCEEIAPRVHRVRDLVEKPPPESAPSDLAIIGRYVLSPTIFECLEATAPDARGEIQLTDGLRLLLQREPIYAVEFEGRRFDAGDKLGFLQATIEIALKRADLGGDLRRYLRGLNLD